MVSESVQQAGDEFGIAGDLYPFTEGAIGGVLLAHCTIGRNVTCLTGTDGHQHLPLMQWRGLLPYREIFPPPSTGNIAPNM